MARKAARRKGRAEPLYPPVPVANRVANKGRPPELLDIDALWPKWARYLPNVGTLPIQTRSSGRLELTTVQSAATIGQARGRTKDTNIKIALAQIEVKVGKPAENVQRMLEMIDEAKAQGADLVAFPEMAVGGYLVGDEWNNDAYCEDLMLYNEVLRRASKGIAVAWGNICLDKPEDMARRGLPTSMPHPNKDGGTRKYNAVYVAQDGKWARKKKEHTFLPRGVSAKTLLPNNSVFDDERYFFSLQRIAQDFGVPLEELLQPFMIKKNGEEVPIGFECCEDMWSKNYRENLHPLNPTEILINNGARQIVNVSASPASEGKVEARDDAVAYLHEQLKDRFVPLYYVNKVGCQNNTKNFIPFDGRNTIYGAHGKPIAFLEEAYEPGLLMVDDVRSPPLERPKSSKIREKYEAVLQGIRHLKDTSGFPDDPKFVIGVSGGVDSAVSLALLVKAVGPEKVYAVNMPSEYNSEETIGAYHRLVANLGIDNNASVPIDGLMKSLHETLGNVRFNGEKPAMSSLVEENMQAKIRATDILSNLAQMLGGVFVNNGNKLEVATGYATLYGDWGGAVSILGDVFKDEVYEMAHFLNEEIFGREVIPEALLPDELFRFGEDKIKPSAELKDAQEDPFKVGYHDAVLRRLRAAHPKAPQDLMQWFLDGTLHEELGISVELMQRYGVDDPKAFAEDLRWLSSLTPPMAYKRGQAPPIIITTGSSYGYDYREAIKPAQVLQAEELLHAQLCHTRDAYRPRSQSPSSGDIVRQQAA